jgi:hypothetical protein
MPEGPPMPSMPCGPVWESGRRAAQNLGFGEHEWHFDPGQPPPVKATLFSNPPQKHEDVKEAWDTAEEHLVDIGNDYPA